MIMRLRVIAMTSLREALRSRLFISLLVVYTLALLGIAVIVAGSLGDETRIFHDLAHAALSISGSMVALFVAVNLIAADIERKTLHLILARPVLRVELIVGKFLGLALLLGLYTLAATLLYSLVAAGGPDTTVDGKALLALLLLWIEFLIVGAVAMLFSAMSGATTAAVYGLLVFVIGRLGDAIRLLAERHPSPLYKGLAQFIRVLIPDLTAFDLNPRLPMPELSQLAASVGYGLAWIIAIVGLAALAFRRRDLK